MPRSIDRHTRMIADPGMAAAFPASSSRAQRSGDTEPVCFFRAQKSTGSWFGCAARNDGEGFGKPGHAPSPDVPRGAALRSPGAQSADGAGGFVFAALSRDAASRRRPKASAANSLAKLGETRLIAALPIAARALAARAWRIETHGRGPVDDKATDEERAAWKAELEHLRQEHRDLDAAIEALIHIGSVDRLQIQRLKKRKLALRDRMSFLDDQLTPDIIA